MTGTIASAANVFDTAISVTDARSRRASAQARAISCSTLASPFGECADNEEVFCGAMLVGRSVNLRGNSNFSELGKGFLNHSPYPFMWGWGPKMSRVSFNRNRVKLKQLLG